MRRPLWLALACSLALACEAQNAPTLDAAVDGAEGADAPDSPRDAPLLPSDGTTLDAGTPSCVPVAGAVEAQAALVDSRLTEVSGIVASRRDPGVRYVHNDSGEAVARFFAVNADGTTLAEIVIDGAPSPRDWEDVAIETDALGREVLTFGDVGDNAARDGSGTPRTSVSVVRVEPPPLPATPSATALHVAPLAVTTLVYPDAPHDCEAIFVDARGDLYLITKENAGPAGLYRATAPLLDAETRTLERLIDAFPADALVTGADADARFVVVRNYGRAWIFTLAGRSVADTLAAGGLRLPSVTEPQGEAIALEYDGSGVLFASEGLSQPVHFVPFTCAP